MFDVACKARQAITGFFLGVVIAGLNPVFDLLGRTVLASPRVDQMTSVHSLWTGSVVIANTCFVLLVIIGGMLIMGHGSLQSSYTVKDIAPRLVVGMVAANLSLPAIGQAIAFANGLSAALMGQDLDPFKAANTLKGLVVAAIADNANPFMPLLALIAVIAGLVVLVTFIVRIMMLVLLTAAAPLALACHALPHTEGLARLWWRFLVAVLAIQVAQALVLIAALRVFFSSNQAAVFGIRSRGGVFALLLVICLLYVLARIPAWVARSAWQSTLGSSPIARTAKAVAALLIFRKITGRGGTGRAPRVRSAPVRSATMGGDGALTPAEVGRHAPRATWLPRNPIKRAFVQRFAPPPVRGGEGASMPTNIVSRAPRVSWPTEQRRYPPGRGAPPKNPPPRPPQPPMPPRPWPYNNPRFRPPPNPSAN